MEQLDRLNCEQVFKRLDDYLDRELSAAEMKLVRKHLETCAWCAATYEFQEEALNALRERVERIAAPAALRRKVSAALRKVEAEAS